jgi:hypothetical protein
MRAYGDRAGGWWDHVVVPHACIATKPTKPFPRLVAVFQKGKTHICEETNSTKTYCGLDVASADQPPSDCRPIKDGRPTCRTCATHCHTKHPDLPNAS